MTLRSEQEDVDELVSQQYTYDIVFNVDWIFPLNQPTENS